MLMPSLNIGITVNVAINNRREMAVLMKLLNKCFLTILVGFEALGRGGWGKFIFNQKIHCCGTTSSILRSQNPSAISTSRILFVILVKKKKMSFASQSIIPTTNVFGASKLYRRFVFHEPSTSVPFIVSYSGRSACIMHDGCSTHPFFSP